MSWPTGYMALKSTVPTQLPSLCLGQCQAHCLACLFFADLLLILQDSA